MLTPLEQKSAFLCRQARKCAFLRRGESKGGVQERGAATSDEPLLCALRIAQRKKKVQTRALRGSAQSFIGKKPYLNLRLRAASDFFLRLTEGFS